MNNAVKVGAVYQHYKGNTYTVVCIANHTETHEPMVVYQSVKDEHEYWVRPYGMFCESVDVNGQIIPRFTFVSL